MQTQLAPAYQQCADGKAAEALLRKCVHCGFCTATCPTYQLLGDESDSPRGRIYLIKQLLEGQTPSRATQLHLDRCLTCRNCETTCPSGVEYGHLLDIGRKLVDAQVPRPPGERALRWALKTGLPSPAFAPAMRLGQMVRPLLPAALQAKVPARQDAGTWPKSAHAHKVLLLGGCVQPAMAPNINTATARVLDAADIQCLLAPQAGCCGAVAYHLNDQEGGKRAMRALIDAWWPYVRPDADPERRVRAIVMTASGCGATVKDYGHILSDDPDYADKARHVSACTRDLSELLPDVGAALVQRFPGLVQHNRRAAKRVAFHPPCTLQHAQRLRGAVETELAALGFSVHVAASEAYLCCGSAGTYSVLQPELATRLRERKLRHLQVDQPDVITSANIGCITHLQSGTNTPVRHWVEVLDEALAACRPAS